MLQATRAGVAYFALVFFVGFVLGTLRTFVVAPAIGETESVALELPLILGWSWFTAKWIATRQAVPTAWAPRLVMGLVAFLCLMAAELTLSYFAFGRSLSEHLALYQTAPAALGFAGQVGYALIPALQAAPWRASRKA